MSAALLGTYSRYPMFDAVPSGAKTTGAGKVSNHCNADAQWLSCCRSFHLVAEAATNA
jgi:hypothetical protein